MGETRDPKKSSNVSFPPIYAIYATKSEFIENGSSMQQAMGFSSIIFNSVCHQPPSKQYSYYKFKLIRDNYSIIIVTLYISNVRYTCLYIITRYHSSYQIQTIIHITSKFVRKLNKNY